MPLTQINNIQAPKLSERIAQITNLDNEIDAVFRAVYAKTNNGWSMLIGIIALDERSHLSKFEPCHYQYPEYKFICQSISGLTLADLIRNIVGDGIFSRIGIPEFGMRESNPNWTENLIPSHSHEAQFPARRFSARVSSDNYCQDCKLVAHGMPFHLSAFEKVKDFLGLAEFHGSSDARRGELCIDIPDRRGHLMLSGDDVGFHSNMSDALSLVGAIDGISISLVKSNEKYAFQWEKASDVELWLVTKDDEVVDYCSSSEWDYRYGNQTNTSDVEQMLEIISAGESEHCEFKAYIDLVTKVNTKACDLEKAVCAFSNHQGGMLFIGVDDDTTIIGINEKCQKDYKCSPSDAAEHYRIAVDKHLRESLLKNQCFGSRIVEHNERIIIAIDVHKANGLNYLLQKKEAHIRRGASSPKMTPIEIQAFPAEKGAYDS